MQGNKTDHASSLPVSNFALNVCDMELQGDWHAGPMKQLQCRYTVPLNNPRCRETANRPPPNQPTHLKHHMLNALKKWLFMFLKRYYIHTERWTDGWSLIADRWLFNTPSIIRRTRMKRHCLRVDKYAYDQFKQCKTSVPVNFINIMQKMTQKYKWLSPLELNYAD